MSELSKQGGELESMSEINLLRCMNERSNFRIPHHFEATLFYNLIRVEKLCNPFHDGGHFLIQVIVMM